MASRRLPRSSASRMSHSSVSGGKMLGRRRENGWLPEVIDLLAMHSRRWDESRLLPCGRHCDGIWVRSHYGRQCEIIPSPGPPHLYTVNSLPPSPPLPTSLLCEFPPPSPSPLQVSACCLSITWAPLRSRSSRAAASTRLSWRACTGCWRPCSSSAPGSSTQQGGWQRPAGQGRAGWLVGWVCGWQRTRRAGQGRAESAGWVGGWVGGRAGQGRAESQVGG